MTEVRKPENLRFALRSVLYEKGVLEGVSLLETMQSMSSEVEKGNCRLAAAAGQICAVQACRTGVFDEAGGAGYWRRKGVFVKRLLAGII